MSWNLLQVISPDIVKNRWEAWLKYIYIHLLTWKTFHKQLIVLRRGCNVFENDVHNQYEEYKKNFKLCKANKRKDLVHCSCEQWFGLWHHLSAHHKNVITPALWIGFLLLSTFQSIHWLDPQISRNLLDRRWSSEHGFYKTVPNREIWNQKLVP